MLYSKGDKERIIEIRKYSESEEIAYRSPWRRDFGRVIHSPSFRRLRGKSQVFPWAESDFFRDRLTHSLEVAQIAKSIALKLNKTNIFFKEDNNQINPDIVEIAGLCHDVGLPPFGHNGEIALDDYMKKDHGGFEGNAQTLRILSKLEKRQKDTDDKTGIDDAGEDKRCGLNLTFRSLASILKYDKEIPVKREKEDKLVKGYYYTESALVENIKKKVIGTSNFDRNFKTIECQIMDIADDISYSTYDLEDAFKARFLTPFDCVGASDNLVEMIAKRINEKPSNSQSDKKTKLNLKADDVRRVLYSIFDNIFDPEYFQEFEGLEIDLSESRSTIAMMTQGYNVAMGLVSDGYSRSQFTSSLVSKFINGICIEPDNDYPALSTIYLEEETLEKVEVLKNITYCSLILSPRFKIVEYRGKEIIEKIFDSLTDSDEKGFNLLPDDYRSVYNRIKDKEKKRVICDFISGMTDRYALEFYGRLTSENPQTIFKP